jgi:hypothetical protein
VTVFEKEKERNPKNIGYSVVIFWRISSPSCLKGQSHEKVGEMRVEGDRLGPN